jgi:hypothetical protein
MPTGGVGTRLLKAQPGWDSVSVGSCSGAQSASQWGGLVEGCGSGGPGQSAVLTARFDARLVIVSINEWLPPCL